MFKIFKRNNDRDFNTLLVAEKEKEIQHNRVEKILSRNEYEIYKTKEQMSFYKSQIEKYNTYSCVESKLRVEEYKKLLKQETQKLHKLQKATTKNKFTRILEILISK